MKEMIIKAQKKKWLFVITVLFLVACADQKWSDFYSKPDFVAKGSNWDVLSKNTDYKTFMELLVKSGCDSVLKSGSSHTVLAVKNDALAAVNANMPVEKLKELMGMHITSSVLYSAKMSQNNMPAVSGKMLYFSGTSANPTVNNAAINVSSEIRTVDGVIYNVDKVIDAFPSLYEIITTHPDLTALNDFITDNTVLTPDPLNNVLLRYDSLNRPVYEEPINYIAYSEFLEFAQPDNESIQSTAFLPSNEAVKKALEGMLAAKGGERELIIPRLPATHLDTVVGHRYFKTKIPYQGDTTEFLRKYFAHAFIRGNVSSLSGNQTFTDINLRALTVSSGAVKTSIPASNGYIHIMHELEAPALFYRNTFIELAAIPTVADAMGVMQWVVNPNLIPGPGASTPSRQTQVNTYPGYWAKVNFNRIGNHVNFRFPLVTPGKYEFYYNFWPENVCAALDISYEDQVIVRNQRFSGNNTEIYAYEAKFGTIQVKKQGEVLITFTSVDIAPYQNGRMDFDPVYVKLVPVDE